MTEKTIEETEYEAALAEMERKRKALAGKLALVVKSHEDALASAKAAFQRVSGKPSGKKRGRPAGMKMNDGIRSLGAGGRAEKVLNILTRAYPNVVRSIDLAVEVGVPQESLSGALAVLMRRGDIVRARHGHYQAAVKS